LTHHSQSQPSVRSESPTATFTERRRRLQRLLAARLPGARVLVASGLPQPRNFPANHYPFRANSHFIYLTGVSLQGALLELRADQACLYAEPPDPQAAIWTGEELSIGQLAEALALEVRPIDDFSPSSDLVCVPPSDALTTLWLNDVAGQELEPAYGQAQSEAGATLADVLIELRLVHDAAAIEQMRRACGVTVHAHTRGMQATAQSTNEAEVRAAIEEVIARSGMGLAYQSIVTTHGEVLHNERSDGTLTPGQLLLCDVGAETNEGWASDVTRTWPTRGRFSATQREIYEVVLAAQHSAIAQVAPGVRYRDVHWAASKELARGLRDLGILRGDLGEIVEHGVHAVFFPHGVGHLLGLDVHDMEDLGDRAGYAAGRERATEPALRYLRLDRDLAAGMVVTIEPGFYQIEGLLAAARDDAVLRHFIDWPVLERFADVRGIRIEDDVLVTGQGAEVLTAGAPKSVADVERALADSAHSSR
jgi:Xaa-Pro aminopeptidase